MMSATTRIDTLLAYFNRGILDVPTGLFDRNTMFSLNGATYESRLGRSADDPLVRLIARGPAGYRFIATALLHALEHAHAAVGHLDAGANGASGTILLMGELRGSHERFEEVLGVTLAFTPAGALASVDVTMEEAALERLRSARQR